MPGLSYLTGDGGLDWDQMTNVARAVGNVSQRGLTGSQYAVAATQAGLRERAKSLSGNDWQGERSKMMKYANSLSALNDQKMTRSGRMAALRSVLDPLGEGMDEMDDFEARKRREAAAAARSAAGAPVGEDPNKYTNTATGLGMSEGLRKRMQQRYETAKASRQGLSPSVIAAGNKYLGESRDPMRFGMY
jgi:hypothetical protein